MLRQLSRSRTATAVIYASVAGARRILGMAITVPTAHIFGPVFYGQLNVATTLLFLASTLFALGLEIVVFRASARGDNAALVAVRSLLCLTAPCVGFAVSLAILAARLSLFGLSPTVLALVILTAAFTPSNAAFFNAVTRARDEIGRFLSRNLVLLCASTALKAILILAFHAGLQTWLLVELVVAIGGWAFALRAIPRTTRERLARRSVLASSLPLLPHTLMHWIVGTSDRLLIAGMLGVKSLAIYAATYTVPSFLSVALGEINSAYMSTYARNPDPAAYTEHAVKQTRLFGAVTALTALAGPLLTKLVFPTSLTGSVWLIPILCTGYMAFAMYLIVANILTLAANATSTMLTLSAAGAAVNFGANVLAIPRFGLPGAAVTTLLGYCAMVAVGCWQLGRRGMSMPWRALCGRGLLILWTGAMLIAGISAYCVYR